MSNKALNVVTILLLMIVAFGIFTIPQFNYDELMNKQSWLERQVVQLSNRVEAFDSMPMSPADRAKRLAALRRLDALPGLISGLRDDYQVFSELLARSESAAEGAESQRLEGDSLRNERVGYTDPLVLPDELREIAETIAPRVLLDSGFESFLSQAVESGIVSTDTDPEALPERFVNSARRVFSIYSANMELIRQEMLLHVEEEVASATATGDYVQVPLDSAEHGTPTVDAPSTIGVQHVQLDHENGVKRVYAFPVEEYPELIEYYEEMRQNARDHLVRDMERLGRELLD